MEATWKEKKRCRGIVLNQQELFQSIRGRRIDTRIGVKIRQMDTQKCLENQVSIQNRTLLFVLFLMSQAPKQILTILSLLACILASQFQLPQLTIAPYGSISTKVISIPTKKVSIPALIAYNPIPFASPESIDNEGEEDDRQPQGGLDIDPSGREEYVVRSIDYLQPNPRARVQKNQKHPHYAFLQGIERLARASENRVVGRLNLLENRLNRVELERNSIIGAIDGAQVSKIQDQNKEMSSQELGSIQKNTEAKGIPAMTSQSLSKIKNLANVAARLQPTLVSDLKVPTKPTLLSTQTLKGEQDDQKQNIFKSEMQRRIDNLQAEMFARQRQKILSRLSRDYRLGLIGGDELRGILPPSAFPYILAGSEVAPASSKWMSSRSN